MPERSNSDHSLTILITFAHLSQVETPQRPSAPADSGILLQQFNDILILHLYGKVMGGFTAAVAQRFVGARLE